MTAPVDLVADLLSLMDDTVDPDTHVKRVWMRGPNTIGIEVKEFDRLREFNIRVTEVNL